MTGNARRRLDRLERRPPPRRRPDLSIFSDDEIEFLDGLARRSKSAKEAGREPVFDGAELARLAELDRKRAAHLAGRRPA